MPKFRKKPVVIEARRLDYDARSTLDLEKWLGEWFESWIPSKRQLIIRTLEGEHVASDGDWIICGVKGEFYACRDDIFRMTYEPEPEFPKFV